MADPRLYIMDDVGTRMQHYMELQDVWSHGLQVLTGPGWHSQKEQTQAGYIIIALALLQDQLEADYHPTQQKFIAQEINKLEKTDLDIT